MAKLIRWTIKDLAECIDAMQENEFDCVVFIEGKRGIGKSTLAQKVAYRLKCGFDPWRDIWYTREEVIKALATRYKGIVMPDELVGVSYNRDHYEKEQKVLIKALNMCRDQYNVFIGCIPFFSTLDTQMKELCKIRISIIRRGVALIHLQNNTIFSNDPWDTRNNAKVEAKWIAKKVKHPHYSKLTTVKGILFYNDITPRQKEEYLKVKKARRNRVFKDYINEDEIINPEKTFYKRLLERIKKGGMTVKEFNDLCIITGRKPKSVRRNLNDLFKEEGTEKTTKDFIRRETLTLKKDFVETDSFGYSTSRQ